MITTTHGMLVTAAIEPSMRVSLDLIALLATISHSAKDATKRTKHIYINSAERRSHSLTNLPKTVET